MTYTLAHKVARGVSLIVSAPDPWDAPSAVPSVEALSYRPADWALSPIGLRRFAPIPPAVLPAPLPELPPAHVDYASAESLARTYLATYGAEIVSALIAREVTP